MTGWGALHLLFFSGSGAVTPESFLAAFASFWTTSGLAATAPLRTNEAEPLLDYPLVILEDFEADSPGPSANEFPIRLWLRVQAIGEQAARTIAQTVIATIDIQLSGRSPLTWIGGQEITVIRHRTPSPKPKRMRDGQLVNSFRIQYEFWIDGDPGD
jgi:hypothetical protein